MQEKQIIEQTKQFVKTKLNGEGSGHDWWHIVRVYNSALDIASKETPTNSLIIKLGALLHDIADHKFGHSDIDRTNIITGFLKPLGVKDIIINEVIYIANNISFKGGTNKQSMKSLEAKIVQDADRLDAIGAIGIGRTFAYGGYVKRVMYNPKSSEKDLIKLNGYTNNDTVSHFYEKLLLLKEKMNTKAGKEKAIQRHIFMEKYLEQFYNEWDGSL